MILFDEVYGSYYACVENLVRNAPLSQADFRRILSEMLSIDGGIDLSERLTDGRLPMLRVESKQLASALAHAPERPLTDLERAYLRTLCDDPRAALFLEDAQLARLRQQVGEGERLFSQADFVSYDRSREGDDFGDAAYRAHFHALRAAIRQGGCVKLRYTTQNGVTQYVWCRPMLLEYSGKDDMFRLHAVNVQGKRLLCNLARIDEIMPAPAFPLPDVPERERCEEPLLIEVTSERNGIARFMLEFSYLEKRSEYDAARDVARVQLWYPKSDETEILVRLLSFGPVLQVLSPAPFVEKIRERMRRQLAAMR